ncbi:4-hydroxyphenylacetate catabolism regulatory protein HpaA [Pasteurella multocida]|uniref:4-hydroxyphenylacetate catabolism regulatory protein HpaA n=1 Tax=Pasteurella multocida TaxID=747 RepID=UPI002877BD8E|nr:4-hydroxyphenylacetate catabolism regulatory protein HpaA [Pasteurella multocida]WND41582.1 4-hydroxyphenylacetate catabolism regulatory protein HpaA [Pasteurella multocida]
MRDQSFETQNINIEKTYGGQESSSIIHYETFDNLALFYGRKSLVHFHDRFYQVHYLTEGSIALQLDAHEYRLYAPCFFITPPSIPHGFYTDLDTHGHVLTIPQEFVWQLLESLKRDINYFYPMCIELSPQEEAQQIFKFEYLFNLLAEEYRQHTDEKQTALRLSAKLILLEIYRLSKSNEKKYSPRNNELYLFNQFNFLIEDNFKNNWRINDYLDRLCISESKLNAICQHFSATSPKRLIIERQIQEAKRKLLFTQHSIYQIAYDLGFKDPAYFSRFFQKETQLSPKAFRDQDHISSNPS